MICSFKVGIVEPEERTQVHAWTAKWTETKSKKINEIFSMLSGQRLQHKLLRHRTFHLPRMYVISVAWTVNTAIITMAIYHYFLLYFFAPMKNAICWLLISEYICGRPRNYYWRTTMTDDATWKLTNIWLIDWGFISTGFLLSILAECFCNEHITHNWWHIRLLFSFRFRRNFMEMRSMY